MGVTCCPLSLKNSNSSPKNPYYGTGLKAGQQEPQRCDGSITALRNDPRGPHQGTDIAQEGKSLKCSSPGRSENHPRRRSEENEEREQRELCMGEILGMGQREGKGEVQDDPMRMCTPAKETQTRATCCTVGPQEQGSAALAPAPPCSWAVAQQSKHFVKLW